MLSSPPDVTGHGSKASVNISILTIEINHNVSRETLNFTIYGINPHKYPFMTFKHDIIANIYLKMTR